MVPKSQVNFLCLAFLRQKSLLRGFSDFVEVFCRFQCAMYVMPAKKFSNFTLQKQSPFAEVKWASEVSIK
jgi:uncharacterized protein YutD